MPPEASRSELAAASNALGLSLTSAQQDALLAHLAMLDKWNRVYNLTAVRNPADMLRQHVIDSLAVVGPLIRELKGKTSPVLLDVGSGAGLPGVVLAIALPQLRVTCVDTVGKKSRFVQQVGAELGLANLRSVHARVEQLAPVGCDVVTSRAFASLADFVQLTRRHLASGGIWMAMKGKPPADEVAALSAHEDVFHVEPVKVPGLAVERCIVWMRPVNPTVAPS